MSHHRLAGVVVHWASPRVRCDLMAGRDPRPLHGTAGLVSCEGLRWGESRVYTPSLLICIVHTCRLRDAAANDRRIKTICNQYDSPSVAFYCGQTDGFDYYVTDLYADPRLQSNPLAQCLQPPEGCSAPNYYTNGLPSFTIPNVNLTIPPLYTGYGYTASVRP